MKVFCLIIGGGEHAKVVIDLLEQSGHVEVHGILDRDSTRWGQRVHGVQILGDNSLLPELRARGLEYFIVGLGSTGDNRPRQRLFEMALAHGFRPLRATHPRAIVSPTSQIGGGTVIMAGAVLNPDSRIGANVIVNTGAIVEHDCVIGNHVHLATGSLLAGRVSVGDGAHIGIGASIRQGLRIGENAVVGAGTVVVKDVPAGVVVVGVPARILNPSRRAGGGMMGIWSARCSEM